MLQWNVRLAALTTLVALAAVAGKIEWLNFGWA